jgi:hypothetical protein
MAKKLNLKTGKEKKKKKGNKRGWLLIRPL